MNPRRLSIVLLAAAAASLAGPARTAMAADRPVRSIERATPLDRDGDGEIGEAWAIRQRARLYAEHHGENGRIEPEVQLRRARLGYGRWLEQEHDFRTKGATGDTFVSLGPNNGAGRAITIAPHPTEIGTLLVGFAGGGVWRTRDAGATWEPLTDGMPDLSTGAVAYAPSDPDIVYAGTGEGGYGIDFISGIGLLRSDDGGDTWILPDEVVASQFYAISVDPRDPETLLAGTSEGLIRSTDGGATWTTPIPAKPNGNQRELVVTDVVRSRQNPDLLYTALWCFDGCPAGMGRVMRSTDGGVSWVAADTGLPRPASSWGLNRIAMALSPDHDDVLVVGMNRSGSGTPPSEIWRTDDGGTSWRKLGHTDAYLGGQGWYDNTISIRPGGTDFIIAAGVYYVFTTNGGTGWLTRNPYQMGGLPHVDFHDIEWQAGTLWVACDGGIWKSGNSGSTWTDCNSGLITRQYYGMDIDPVHRERVFAGAQDNGTNRRRDTGDNAWDEVLGGDGFECGVNPLVPDIVYGTIYSTNIFRSTNGGTNFRNVSPRYGQDEYAPFLTPLTLHPARPWELLTGTTRVWRSPDGGDSWQPLPTSVENGSWNQSTVAAVAATRADGRVLMVAKGADVYRSDDGGITWRQAPRGDGGLPGSRVLNVEISPFDASVALACIRTTSGTPLYRTSDGGLTWTPSGDGLPTFPVQVARWDPTDPDIVYAGSDLGLYRSTDGGVTWQPYGSGLPSASVQDIRILPDGSMLRVATHGRGVWGLEMQSESNQPPAAEITSGTGVVVVDVDETAPFSGRATDPDGDTVTTRWVFTDDWSTVNGSSAPGTVETSTSHTFAIGGTYLATLVASDGRGGQATASVTVRVDDDSNYCESPRTVPPDGPFPVTLLGNNTVAGSSSRDPHPPCVDNPDDAKVGTWGSMWFEFTPAESHTYTISTCGSGADTVLSVWTGAACGPYTPVTAGCNDDDEIVHCAGARTDSYVEVDLEAGTTYRIMVGSYASSSKGRFSLTVDCADCPHPLPERLYLLPAAARSVGSNGTFWRTDLVLTNTGEADVSAALAFLEAGRDNTDVDEVDVTVPAGGSLELADVVGSVLGASGSGAVRILSQGDLLVSSRTYTDSDGGTFGQFIPGERAETGIGAGQAVRLLGLAENAAYRTNVGLVNTTGEVVEASIDLLDGAGAVLGTESVRLEPFGWKQLNRIFSSNGLDGLDTAQAVVRTTSGSGAVIPYASVVDNLTGDPVYVAPVLTASEGADLWIAAAAHVAGYNGSSWRTDLTVAATETADASVRIQYLPADSDNGSPTEAAVTIPAGGATLIPDVLDTLFGAEGAGALRLIVASGTVQAVSRTYNETANGTYGQFIPAVPSTVGIGENGTGVLVQLRKDTAFHTNVGLVNLTGAPVETEITWFAADGTALGTRTVTLPAFSFHQENRAIPGTPEGPVTATVRCTTPGGLILAYGSVVDDASGDPIFVPAVPVD